MRHLTLPVLSVVILLSLSRLPLDQISPVSVRFAEGAVHGFLTLRTTDNEVIAFGDVRQVNTGGAIESRTVFHFKDGSLSEETVVYDQQKVFSLQKYQLVQQGPAFAE